MTTTEFKKLLVLIGLTDKEIKVYKFLLGSGKILAVPDIAKGTKINRTTIYSVLQRLIDKGLVSELGKVSRIYYQAESPDRLKSLLESQQSQIDQRVQALENLSSVYHHSQRNGSSPSGPILFHYEGLGKMANTGDESDCKSASIYPTREICNETVREQMELLACRSQDNNEQTRSIVSAKPRKIRQKSKQQNKSYVNENEYHTPVSAQIFSDHIRFDQIGMNTSSLVVEHPDLVRTMKVMYDLAEQFARMSSDPNMIEDVERYLEKRLQGNYE